MTIISKARIKREYEAIREHESCRDSIEWTMEKLNVTEGQVRGAVFDYAASGLCKLTSAIYECAA